MGGARKSYSRKGRDEAQIAIVRGTVPWCDAVRRLAEATGDSTPHKLIIRLLTECGAANDMPLPLRGKGHNARSGGLSPEAVVLMRRMVGAGITCKEIAQAIKKPVLGVQRAVSGLSWSHVEEPIPKRIFATKANGRWRTGPKIPDDVVRAIRILVAEGHTSQEIAEAMEIGLQFVRSVKRERIKTDVR